MTKRLKYTKDILTHMLNNNNKPGATAAMMSGTGGITGALPSSSNRPGTISSAVNSKRSVISGADFGTMGGPSSITGRTGSS